MNLLSILSLVAFVARQVQCSYQSVPLINYNKWNLPFARNFTIESNDDSSTVDFPTGTYIMNLNPAAFFSVIFLDSELI